MAKAQAAFDYKTLDVETRVLARQRASEIHTIMRHAATGIIDIGMKLIEVKAAIDHGFFLKWLDAEFQWSADTAERYMRVGRAFDGKRQQIAQIAPTALYLLSRESTPEAAREAALAAAGAGERVTPAAARAIVDASKDDEELEEEDEVVDAVPTDEMTDDEKAAPATLAEQVRQEEEEVEAQAAIDAVAEAAQQELDEDKRLKERVRQAFKLAKDRRPRTMKHLAAAMAAAEEECVEGS